MHESILRWSIPFCSVPFLRHSTNPPSPPHLPHPPSRLNAVTPRTRPAAPPTPRHRSSALLTPPSTSPQLLSSGTELSDGTKETTASSGGNGGNGGIYGCILLLLASALAIVLAIRAHFRGGLMADVERIQDWAAGVPGTVTGSAMYIFGELQEADDHAEVCKDGLLLSGPSMTPLNAGFYVFLLLWSFVGVAIAADVFMVAIEVITSSESTKVTHLVITSHHPYAIEVS